MACQFVGAGWPVLSAAPTVARKTSSRVGCFSTYSTSAGGSSALSSASVPLTTIRPSCRIAIRSASCSASSRYCVVSSTVVPWSASSLTDFHTSIRASGSSPVVGSSRKITGGLPIRLIAMSRRRRMPPEYVATRGARPRPSSKRVSRSSAIGSGFFRCRSRAIRIRFSRPVRILVDGRELPGQADRLPHLAGCVATSKPWTVAVPASGLSRVDRMLHHRRLARSVGAEQGEDASRRDVEVDAAQDPQVLERLLQPLHADRRDLRCGHRVHALVPVLCRRRDRWPRSVVAAPCRSTGPRSSSRGKSRRTPPGRPRRCADRGSVRRALLEQVDQVLEHPAPARRPW